MKTLLFLVLLCCVAGTVSGQAPASFPIDKVTRRMCYTAVVPAAGVSRADLQARARAWASGIAPADKPPVVANEPDTDVVTAYGAQPFTCTFALANKATGLLHPHTIKRVLHYTAKLSLREGRYRYEVTDFVFEYPAAKPPSPARWPAEDDLIKMRAINEDGDRLLTAERKNFAEAVAKLQAQLKEKMDTPIIQAEGKQ